MVEIKRKLYKRGSSYETTIPMPMLFSLDLSKKYYVVFKFDSKQMRWYIDFEECSSYKNTLSNRGNNNSKRKSSNKSSLSSKKKSRK